MKACTYNHDALFGVWFKITAIFLQIRIEFEEIFHTDVVLIRKRLASVIVDVGIGESHSRADKVAGFGTDLIIVIIIATTARV